MAKLKKPTSAKASARQGRKITKKIKKIKLVKNRKVLVEKKIFKKPLKKVVVKKTAKKLVKHKILKIKKAVVKKAEEGFAAEALFKAKIKVIGVGGGGG